MDEIDLMEDISLDDDDPKPSDPKQQQPAGPRFTAEGVPFLAPPVLVQAPSDAPEATNSSLPSPEFGDFHSAASSAFVSAPEAPAKPELSVNVNPADVKTFLLPPLYRILSDEQKMAFAALCLFTFTEMKRRYEVFEYVDPAAPPPTHEQFHARAKSNLSTFFGGRFGAEEQMLLKEEDRTSSYDSDGEDQQSGPSLKQVEKSVSESTTTAANPDQATKDTSDSHAEAASGELREEDARPNESTLPRSVSSPAIVASERNLASASESFRGSLDSLAQAQAGRIPFGDIMSYPETIEDIVYLNLPIDGNVALCYAIKTYDIWCHNVMDRLYSELKISAQGMHWTDREMADCHSYRTNFYRTIYCSGVESI